MSFKEGEIKLNYKTRKSFMILAVLGVTEFILTTVFVITFASNILFPEQTNAVANQVAKVLSYEGRLTDANGNALGGSGTNYCFRFSIYDNPIVGSGTKVWPTGTPVRNTVNVTNGVFSVGIGTSTSAVDAAPDDLSTYNFYTSDSAFLNVEATSSLAGSCAGESTFVTLSPRQPLYAVAYARATRDVYGALLKTDNANSHVQIGDGTGTTGDPIFLALDWKSNVGTTFSYVGQSCTTNGSIWYNSSTGHALLCENNLIQELGKNSTTTIDSIGVNAVTPVQDGLVVFSNSPTVTFGLNGSTITASAAGGGGGGGATVNSTVLGNNRGWAQSSSSLGQNSLYIFPQNLDMAVNVSAVKIPVMVTNSSSGFAAHTRGYTMNFGVYTRNATNSTVLTRHYSTSYTAGFSANSNGTWAGSIITAIGNATSYNTVTASSAGLNLSSASFHGPRNLLVAFVSTLSQGEYWFAVRQSSSTAGAAGNLFNLSFLIASSQTVNQLGLASNVVSVGGLAGNAIGLGTYSATTGALPASINMTQINNAATNPIFYLVNAST